MNRLREGLRRSIVLAAAIVIAASGLTVAPASAQSPDDPETEKDWRLLGSFSGSTESTLAQRAWNLLIEMENDGNLYQDLGALSLGFGIDIGDHGKLDWDNYFTRRVYPMHEELPPGAELKAEHLSQYIDLQTMISRGRVRYAYVPDIVDDRGINFQIEGGVSLSLARARSPLHLGDRPLDEVLFEREADDFRTLSEECADSQRNDLLILSAKGARTLTQWIADRFAERADTERAALFWEDFADPVMLGFDLGIPVEADLFSSSDNRLGPGDRVRHLSFIGISPVSMMLKDLGLRVEARYFFRFLRETTIVEEGDDKVLVTVRNVSSRGGELVPLKLRPEIRILGLLKIAYTFFEERWDRGRVASSEMAYRVDLAQHQGRESLVAFLDDGNTISFRPLDEATKELEAVEQLDWKTTRGDMRTGFRRAQFFKPLRYFNRKLTSLQKVQHEDLSYHELKIARNSEYRKTWGKDHNWRRQFLLQSIIDPHWAGENSKTGSESAAIVTFLTTYRDSFAELDGLRGAAAGIEGLAGPHPALDAFVDFPPGQTQHAFVNLELSLGARHLTRIRESSENEAWEILADILLGPEHRSEWSSPQNRAHWNRRTVRSDFAMKYGEDVENRRTPSKRRLNIGDRYRLARRTIKKFRKVQKLLEDGDCTSCAHSAFRKWKDVTMLQIVLFRLGALAEGEDPGYHYEVFSDRMMHPVTVTNEVRHTFTSSSIPNNDPGSAHRVEIDRSLTAENLQSEVRAQQTDWFGRKHFLKPSDGRLQGGFLYQRTTPDPSGEDYCIKLRLFTDFIIEPELSLRVDLREERQKTADVTLKSSRFPLGEPTEVVETPFRTARYHYDVPLPHLVTLEPDKAHTLLVRILNSEGYPVSEEQQIRFRSPEAGFPSGCVTGMHEEIVLPVVTPGF